MSKRRPKWKSGKSWLFGSALRKRT
ncbi:MAG: KxYKxGKxW signal peptide domain-containing protein [Candidatus Melainabacteria bacterium]|nr:KxYKxGKxW signal peptide domain-containing protein [Candidatus Melainabacteria bacterium]